MKREILNKVNLCPMLYPTNSFMVLVWLSFVFSQLRLLLLF